MIKSKRYGAENQLAKIWQFKNRFYCEKTHSYQEQFLDFTNDYI